MFHDHTKPFRGVDPWRQQYFENEPVPDGVIIPIDDATAWELYPRHRWVYNKLLIAETSGLPHGPHGTMPARYPIYSKPIYNMRGMGTGGRVIRDEKEYDAALQPGHMWMAYLVGPHVSTDVALERGKPCWWRSTTGKPAQATGTFDYWTVHAEVDPDLEASLASWIAQHLADFTGVVNFETIGGQLLECHLRMSEQWLDLNGPGWLSAVVKLYAEGSWRLAEARQVGYSVVLFGTHGRRWSIRRSAVDELRQRKGISSIQITFAEDIAPELHAMPPGGFRLAIVNCWDLKTGMEVREELRRLFGAGPAAMSLDRARAG
jgi:hypothetical protein